MAAQRTHSILDTHVHRKMGDRSVPSVDASTNCEGEGDMLIGGDINTDSSRPRRMKWTPEVCTLLMREYIREKPHDATYGAASSKWDAMANNLRDGYPKCFTASFDGQGASLQMCRLLKQQKSFNSKSARGSGMCTTANGFECTIIMLITRTGVTEEYDERRHLMQECLKLKEESDAERALKRDNNISAQRREESTRQAPAGCSNGRILHDF